MSPASERSWRRESARQDYLRAPYCQDPTVDYRRLFDLPVLQFVREIPKDFDEAAMVDGANRWQIYRHVIVPNSGPVFATLAILTFLSSWKAFLWPIMTIQSEDIRPVMVGMQYSSSKTCTVAK